jgi:hypothetical protein
MVRIALASAFLVLSCLAAMAAPGAAPGAAPTPARPPTSAPAPAPSYEREACFAFVCLATGFEYATHLECVSACTGICRRTSSC